MKKGISMLSLSIAIVIIIILVATVTISTQSIMENSNKVKFVSEMILIKDAIDNYTSNNVEFPEQGKITINLNSVSAESIIQFKDENIVSNTITLSLIDYNKIGIKNKQFGNNKDGQNLDVYAFSKETGKIFYLKGIKYQGNTYYTLTEEIAETASVLELKANQIKKEDCIFERRNLYGEKININEYFNNKVEVVIYVPEKAQNISVTYENYDTYYAPRAENVKTDKSGFVKYITNIEAPRNYDVVVKYTLNGVNKTVKYLEDKVDIGQPNIDITNIQIITLNSNGEERKYLTGFLISDDISGLKFKKYILDRVSSAYFNSNGGIDIKENNIDVTGAKYCTIYAEDKAGNVLNKIIDLTNY